MQPNSSANMRGGFRAWTGEGPSQKYRDRHVGLVFFSSPWRLKIEFYPSNRARFWTPTSQLFLMRSMAQGSNDQFRTVTVTVSPRLFGRGQRGPMVQSLFQPSFCQIKWLHHHHPPLVLMWLICCFIYFCLMRLIDSLAHWYPILRGGAQRVAFFLCL